MSVGGGDVEILTSTLKLILCWRCRWNRPKVSENDTGHVRI